MVPERPSLSLYRNPRRHFITLSIHGRAAYNRMNDQLDLFLDSQAVQFIDQIVAAFELRDAQRATTALAMLRAHAP